MAATQSQEPFVSAAYQNHSVVPIGLSFSDIRARVEKLREETFPRKRKGQKKQKHLYKGYPIGPIAVMHRVKVQVDIVRYSQRLWTFCSPTSHTKSARFETLEASGTIFLLLLRWWLRKRNLLTWYGLQHLLISFAAHHKLERCTWYFSRKLRLEGMRRSCFDSAREEKKETLVPQAGKNPLLSTRIVGTYSQSPPADTA